jgi:hypothetical protein
MADNRHTSRPPRGIPPVTWGKFDDRFVDALAETLAGKRVLEVFAGNGYLAAALARRGVEVRATSLFSSHDGHAQGFYHPVKEMEASAAVGLYRKRSDVLLMSWPTATDAAAAAALRWGSERPVVFIGEVTDLEAGQLGGCASDIFFEIMRAEDTIPGYVTDNPLEKAVVYRLDRKRALSWAIRAASGDTSKGRPLSPPSPGDTDAAPAPKA